MREGSFQAHRRIWRGVEAAQRRGAGDDGRIERAAGAGQQPNQLEMVDQVEVHA